MLQELNALDTSLFRAINAGLATPALDWLMLAVSSRVTWSVAAAVLVAFAAWKRHRRLLEFCVALGLTIGICDFVTYQAIKPTFARERPCLQFKDERLLQQWCGGDYGFPSNHAANAMAVTVLVGCAYGRRWALTATFMSLLIGISRIYIGVHFPGDVLGGFAVGAIVGLGCAWLERCFRRLLLARAAQRA